MKVYLKGHPIDLVQKDYVGAGGEGTIYGRGSVAFKVYLDSAKMIPAGKIGELSSIKDPNVIKPEDVLTDAKGRPVGYTMRFVRDTWALCQTFPRVFRDRNGVTHEMMAALVRKLREGVEHVHRAGILLVDLNEMNFLVARKFDDVYFIDADSYQTPHYPATALMPSVHDWRTPIGKFNENSDWFSWGVVTFQMFVGIHPYKGRHPKVAGLEERMRAGVSVFDRDVGLPAVVYPFDVIPRPLRAWYEAVFQKGVRCPPPGDLGGAVLFVPSVRAVSGSALFEIEVLRRYDGQVLGMWTGPNEGGLAVVTDGGVWVDGHRACAAPSGKSVVGFTPKSSRAVLFGGSGPSPRLTDLSTGADIPLPLAFEEFSCHDGRVYLRTSDRVLEVVLHEAGNAVIATTTEVARVMEHTARLYPGVVVQKMLGSAYVSLLASPGAAYQARIPELDKYRILEARYDRGVLMAVGEKGGKYDRLVFRFDLSEGGVRGYDARVVPDVSLAGLNFVVLDTGVCVCITEDEKVEVFGNRTGSSALKSLDDPAVGGDMRLGHLGGIVFSQGDRVCRMRMR